ncbi:hypothetical protein CPT_Marzo_234 [Stenotrophomonas phage Marzo]|nr:hypothetical protein CPT_Marzo_234 [Stenotrophomonas phage Marzo]
MPKFFDHNTSGAPLLGGGQNFNLSLVLKFCLVQAGWTVVWEDATARKICFRNDPNEGTGCYFLVDETANAMAYMDVGEGWNDTTKTLVNSVAFTTGAWVRGTYKGASADNRQWWVLADNRTVYMQISGKFVGQPAETVDGPASSWYQWPFVAGDYIRFDGKPGVMFAGTWINGTSLPSQSNNGIGFTAYGTPDMNRTSPSYGVTRGADGKIATNCVAALMPSQFSSGYLIGESSSITIPDSPYLTFSQNMVLYASNGISNTMGVIGVMRGMWFPNFRLQSACAGMGLDQTFRPLGNNNFTELAILTGKTNNTLSNNWYIGVEKGRPW